MLRLLKKQFFHRALKVMKKKSEKDAKKDKKSKGDSGKEEDKKGKKDKDKKKEVTDAGEAKKDKSVRLMDSFLILLVSQGSFSLALKLSSMVTDVRVTVAGRESQEEEGGEEEVQTGAARGAALPRRKRGQRTRVTWVTILFIKYILKS